MGQNDVQCITKHSKLEYVVNNEVEVEGQRKREGRGCFIVVTVSIKTDLNKRLTATMLDTYGIIIGRDSYGGK